MRILSTLLALLLLSCSLAVQASDTKKKPKSKSPKATATSPAAGPTYTKRQDVNEWAEQMAKSSQLDVKWVKAQLAQARFIPSIPKLILPPTQISKKNWNAYQARFIEPKRIQAGVQFWKENQSTLDRAEQTFGVPPWLVVGIIGVETFYGQHTGNFRTLDALSTLTFDFPKEHPRATERQAFFSKELAQFLLLAHKEKLKPSSIKGSYAGALGLPQFMPSSWAKFAVDFDGDQHIDLFANKADVIGSVANYFKAFQWQTGMPTHYPVTFNRELLDMDALMAPDILPSFSIANFVAKGAVIDGEALAHKGPLALIELLNGDDPPSYVAGTENFYAITRYNWSSYYAMAVIELGQAVENKIKAKP
ncbi:MAG: lytic murein transglycosylase B [Pseudomonadota bacterium]|nr:lytic murein transglycosylase B [Pseudomonadota bacterium]